MEQEELKQSFYWPFQYIPADTSSYDNPEDSFNFMNTFNVDLISDESIDLKDLNGYANINFFLAVGIPAESWIIVQSYYSGAKEDDVWSHVLCMNLNENIIDWTDNKMTQSYFIHVNPVIYMNLTDNKENMNVLIKPIGFDLLNHDPSSSLGINLPKIKELKVSWIKGLRKSKELKNTMRDYINSLPHPIPIKVNDIIYVPKYDLFKVKSIIFEK